MFPNRRQGTSSRLPGAAAVVGAVSLAAALLAAGPAYETPTGLRADRFLAADQMTGADWQVEPKVTNEGFGNTYTVKSRFGTWQAFGKGQAALRIGEIRALAQLEEVSKTEVFGDAVKKSVTAPIDLVASAATQPVETAKAIPNAIGRWFKTTKFKVQEGYHDAQEAKQAQEEKKGESSESDDQAKYDDELKEKSKDAAQSYALSYLKVTAAERRWYAKLGVDPSTDNQPLRAAISSVARVEGLTSFGMKFVGIPSIPGASEIRKTMGLVWGTDPWELRRLNRKRMLKAGLSEETARAFEDNPELTLTHQTALLDALEDLAGVGGRASIIARAIDSASREESVRLVDSTLLLVRFHRVQEPLREILAGTRLPVARTAAGALVSVLLTDELFWTEPMATAARTFADAYAGESAQERQLWVAGEVSPAFRAGAQSVGWSVHDRWQLSSPEDRAAGGTGRGR